MINDLLKKRCPTVFRSLRRLKWRFQYAFYSPLIPAHVGRFAYDLFSDCAGAFLAGPFRGMLYCPHSCGSSLPPKLVGSYEKELHNHLELLLKNRYDRIVNIGCGEGYYAVGCALRSSADRTAVYAYDIDQRARECASYLAQLNHVENRISISALCDHAQFERLGRGRSLIVCDIEGAEIDLLDPGAVPMLNGSDIVVEVHERPDTPNVTHTLLQRFSRSHSTCYVTASERTDEDTSYVPRVWPLKWRRSAVDEHRRYGLGWLVMRSRMYLCNPL